MGGDQPDWTELGKIPSGSKRRQGPTERAPDWHQDPAKMAAKDRQEKLERGELVVAVGPFCVPCGKRFAKQSVYDAHLSGKKHLAALHRMGRTEEAMVCQLDVEAKRRKMQEREEERLAAAGFGAKVVEEDEQSMAAAAARKAEREQRLLERLAMPMPSCVTATSVYDDGTEPADEVSATTSATCGGTSASTSTEPPTTAASVAATLSVATESELAAAGAGTLAHSYTGGTQDGTGLARPNRHTTAAMAASHRRLAQLGDDWLKGVGSGPP